MATKVMVINKQVLKKVATKINRTANQKVTMAKSGFALLMFVLLNSFVISAQAEEVMYRYTGANGETVIDHHIPPEFVSKGYSVLNKSGAVIEKVEPALSQEDMTEQQKKDEAQIERAKNDAWLMERYTDSKDAIRARDRQIDALETLIIVGQTNVNKLKENEVRELSFAAESERQGKEVPKEVVNSLENIRQQLRDVEQQIARNRSEQTKVKATFEGIINRLTEIEQEKATAKAKQSGK